MDNNWWMQTKHAMLGHTVSKVVIDKSRPDELYIGFEDGAALCLVVDNGQIQTQHGAGLNPTPSTLFELGHISQEERDALIIAKFEARQKAEDIRRVRIIMDRLGVTDAEMLKELESAQR